MTITEKRTADGPVRVFISYSHDSPEHSDGVLRFANALRSHGVDAELDQFHSEKIVDWPRWCNEQTSREHSDFVICVCTAEYRRHIEGKVPPERGKGAYWEGALLDDDLYDEKGNCRIVPVLLDNEPESSIPRFLRGWTYCRLSSFVLTDSGYETLLRILTGQPRIVKPVLGTVPVLSVQLPQSKTALPSVQAPAVKNRLGTVPSLPTRVSQSENAPPSITTAQSYVSLMVHAPNHRTCSGKFLVSNRGPSVCNIERIELFAEGIPLPECNLVAVGHWPGRGVNERGTQKLPQSVLVNQPVWVYFRTVEIAEVYRGELPETVILKVFFDCVKEPACQTLKRVSGDHQYHEE
ncbi:MAG: toll/interleukin-1 receptor domain-containing protein [Phycisphaerae bacterium]|nr:toll/interleukin-1 receptor domain-containing protein [Phycisphaerae bacterium]